VHGWLRWLSLVFSRQAQRQCCCWHRRRIKTIAADKKAGGVDVIENTTKCGDVLLVAVVIVMRVYQPL